MKNTASRKNIALLIDAENISANRIGMVMEKLEAIGTGEVLSALHPQGVCHLA